MHTLKHQTNCHNAMPRNIGPQTLWALNLNIMSKNKSNGGDYPACISDEKNISSRTLHQVFHPDGSKPSLELELDSEG